MLKRMVAASVGVLAILASAVVGFYSIQAMGEFKDPNASFAFAALESFSLCSIAALMLWLGIRSAGFARTGRSQSRTGWVRAILLGVGSFLPGFVFSMPLTVIWSRYEWPGDGQAVLGAMAVSAYIGMGVVVICLAVLLKKKISRNVVLENTPPQND